MRKLVFTFLFIVPLIINSQEEFLIDVSPDIGGKKEITIKEGNHTFFMLNFDDSKQYRIKAIKGNLEISKLETPDGFATFAAEIQDKQKEIGTFDLKKGEKLEITIEVWTVAVDGKPISKEKSFEHIYLTEKRGEWRTTFGFNFIYKINQDTYFSSDNGNSTYTITEGRNRDKFDFHPTLMFTWLGNKKYGENKNWQFGWSGGLGYDFNTSLSVFLGKSVIYNENLTLTLGVAFHKQDRLNSEYSDNQIINADLNFDQLHTDYIRMNPFISLAFRLDKNPFGG